MNNEKNIIAIGKGEFIALNLHDKKECAETRDVKFPIEINNMEFLLFSGEVEEESNYEELFNRLNPEFHSRTSISFSEIVFPSEEDITDTIYSQKVFVIIDPKKPQRMFEMHYTADRMFYFLGKIIEFEGNYFIFPYALWGRAVIL